jgi:hypothetical protein
MMLRAVYFLRPYAEDKCGARSNLTKTLERSYGDYTAKAREARLYRL